MTALDIQTGALKKGLNEDFFNIFEKITILNIKDKDSLVFEIESEANFDLKILQSELQAAFPDQDVIIMVKDLALTAKKRIEIEECSMRIFTKPCMICDSTKSYFMTNFLGIRVCEKCIEKAHNEMQNAERKC